MEAITEIIISPNLSDDYFIENSHNNTGKRTSLLFLSSYPFISVFNFISTPPSVSQIIPDPADLIHPLHGKSMFMALHIFINGD